MKRLLFIGLRNVHVYIGTLYVVSLLHLTNHIYICQSLPPSLFLSQCLTPTYQPIYPSFILFLFPPSLLSTFLPILPPYPSTHRPISPSQPPLSPFSLPRPSPYGSRRRRPRPRPPHDRTDTSEHPTLRRCPLRRSSGRDTRCTGGYKAALRRENKREKISESWNLGREGDKARGLKFRYLLD